MQASRGFVGTYIGLEVRIVGPRLAPSCSKRCKFNMASGIFIGLTECELLAIRTKAVSMITEGKTLMSYSDSGSSASKSFAMPPKEMLAEAQYALGILDPQQYPGSVRMTVGRTNWNNPIRN